MSSSNVIRDFSRLAFRSCVECSEPVCNCAANEMCVQSSRTCTSCPTTSCVPTSTSTADSSTTTVDTSSSGPNVGAIAGGVVGGLAFVAIITVLLWWFVIRKRRQAEVAATLAATPAPTAENTTHHQRSRSMQSIASTVLTRASNVIQIAYIPGVTNRSPPETPGTLVPPVPPIPSTHASTYSGDQYLFTPRDLRDSRYSNASSDRRSIATSLARSSVATTIYRNDAIVSPIPAQQVRAARPAMVSVKTTPTSSPIDAPSVPAITDAQLQRAEKVGPQLSSIVARSVVARPVNVKGSKPKVPTVTEESEETESAAATSRSKSSANQNSKFDDSSDDDSDDEVNEKGESSETGAGDIQIAFAPPPGDGPFADKHAAGTPKVTITIPNSGEPAAPVPEVTQAVSTARARPGSTSGSTHRQRTSIGSSRMLDDTIQDSATERSSSPFDDQHEIK